MEKEAKVLKHCRVCGLYALHYRGRRICCDCYIKQQRTIQPPLNGLGILPPPIKRPSRYQGAEYHRQYRLRNKERCNQHKAKWREKVMALRPKIEKLPPPELIGYEALRHIVAKEGECDGVKCQVCPLNYRETCKKSEILAEAERLLSEKVIRN